MLAVDARLRHLQSSLAAEGGRLYLGMGAGGPAFAAPQQALLIVGPPRSGKTTTLVVPNVLAAPGAVVSTSTKADVMAATFPGRAGIGRGWLLDPSGTLEAPAGVTTVRWSPVCASRTWDDALATARAMVGAARPSGYSGEAAHWSERAEALLAPLLHAAALGGDDMRAVLRWVLRRDADLPAAALGRAGASVAADVLAGIVATDAREQSGIWSTAAGTLGAYRSEAALAATVDPNFDPTSLPSASDTVYIAAPTRNQQLVAPLIVAFLEQVRAGAYAAAADDARHNRKGRPPVLLALDEVANIAPIPDLPAMVSEGGGQGLSTMACLQDLSQASARWGRAADGFLTLFGAKVILPGIADLTTLELVSRLGGEVDMPQRSVTRGSRWSPSRRSPTTTWTTQRQRRIPVDAVNQQPWGSAIVLEGHNPPTRVQLTPWWSTAPFAPVVVPEAQPRRSDRGRRTEPGLGRT